VSSYEYGTKMNNRALLVKVVQIVVVGSNQENGNMIFEQVSSRVTIRACLHYFAQSDYSDCSRACFGTKSVLLSALVGLPLNRNARKIS
jgi:hypothetical protein